MKNVYKVLPIWLILLGLVCPGCKSSATTAPLEENKALVRRLTEERNKANWAVTAELFAPDFVFHEQGNPIPLTREEAEKEVRTIHAAFPDVHSTIEDIIAEGDKVVTRETHRGTNTGDFPGTPATGKKATLPLIYIYRINDGKIVEAWEAYDTLSLMQQLGVMP